jgi:hypothetical protein
MGKYNIDQPYGMPSFEGMTWRQYPGPITVKKTTLKKTEITNVSTPK